MKRIIFIILAVITSVSGLLAQNADDALRYSQLFYGGTARFMSMGGAFTALGGDLSSLSQNPGGLGVFRSSELSITPQLFHINTSAEFNGISTDYLYNFNLGQAGIVSNIYSNSTTTGLVSLNFGYSFNKTNNLNQNMLIQGNSPSSSMADYWAESSEGVYFRDLSGAAGIAYDSWIIDTISGSGGISYETVFSNYGDNPPSVYGQNIRRLVSHEGYTGEHAFSLGGNYSNKIFFGATLGITRIKYTSHYEHLESTDIPLASGFQNFTFTDHFENTGTGYSLKIGAIIKPIEMVRIGLAFHSPTLYRIDEYFFQNITSNFTGGDKYEYTNDPMRYNFALTSPFRVLTGAAVQIKKVALVSFDYEYVDYGIARFSETGDNYDYSEKNLAIKNTLQSVSNIRFGGEYRLNKLYLRGGYGYYGKPFKANDDNANLDYRSISFGTGFRERNVSVDFAYTNYKYSQINILYPLSSSFNPAVADISTAKNMFTFTIGYKFGY